LFFRFFIIPFITMIIISTSLICFIFFLFLLFCHFFRLLMMFFRLLRRLNLSMLNWLLNWLLLNWGLLSLLYRLLWRLSRCRLLKFFFFGSLFLFLLFNFKMSFFLDMLVGRFDFNFFFFVQMFWNMTVGKLLRLNKTWNELKELIVRAIFETWTVFFEQIFDEFISTLFKFFLYSKLFGTFCKSKGFLIKFVQSFMNSSLSLLSMCHVGQI